MDSCSCQQAGIRDRGQCLIPGEGVAVGSLLVRGLNCEMFKARSVTKVNSGLQRSIRSLRLVDLPL